MRRVKAFLLRKLTRRETVPFQAATACSFVFLRYDRIGDLIVSLPLVKALRGGFPTTEMILVGSEVNAPVGKYSKLFDEIIVKPKNSLPLWILILWRLRKRKISVTFDLNHSLTPHTLFACLMINSKHVATPYKDGRWGVNGTELEMFDLMPNQHTDKYARPLSEIYLDIARLLRCPTHPNYPYPLSPNIAEIESRSRRTIILNHKGSRSSMRLLDVDLIKIVNIIYKVRPSYIVKMFPEYSDYDRIKNLMKNQCNVEVMPSTSTIIPVIEAVKVAAMVITPDTALVHIAAAFSKPLVAIYANSPSLFNQWKPLNAAISVTFFSASSNSLEGYEFNEISDAIAKLARDLPP